MNLENISTPADLARANEANTVSQFVSQLDGLSPQEALAVCQMLTTKLHKLHVTMAQRDDVTNPLGWAKDAGLLEVAVNILNHIDF